MSTTTHGAITVDPQGASVSVNILDAGGSSLGTARTAADGSGSTALPATISTSHAFYVPRHHAYTLVATLNGVEIAREEVHVGDQAAHDPTVTLETADLELGDASTALGGGGGDVSYDQADSPGFVDFVAGLAGALDWANDPTGEGVQFMGHSFEVSVSLSTLSAATGLAFGKWDGSTHIIFNTSTDAINDVAVFVPGDDTDTRYDIIAVSFVGGGWEWSYIVGTPGVSLTEEDLYLVAGRAAVCWIEVPANATTWVECTFHDTRDQRGWGWWEGGTIKTSAVIAGGASLTALGGDIVTQAQAGRAGKLAARAYSGVAASVEVWNNDYGVDAFIATAQGNEDGSDDLVGFFGGSLTRQARPTIDPTSDTAAVQAIVQLLATLGLCIDGS